MPVSQILYVHILVGQNFWDTGHPVSKYSSIHLVDADRSSFTIITRKGGIESVDQPTLTQPDTLRYQY